MLSTGIVHNPFSCGGEEEIALSVGIDISFDIVIVFAEGIVDFAPVIVMIGTVRYPKSLRSRNTAETLLTSKPAPNHLRTKRDMRIPKING